MALALIGVVVGCSQSDEDTLRAELATRFDLGETLHFASKFRCTGAMFALNSAEMLDEPRIYRSMQVAQAVYRQERFAILRDTGRTAAELTDALLLTRSGEMGKQALRSVSLSQDCFEDRDIRILASETMHQPGAVLVVYPDRLVVIDSDRMRILYARGVIR